MKDKMAVSQKKFLIVTKVISLSPAIFIVFKKLGLYCFHFVMRVGKGQITVSFKWAFSIYWCSPLAGLRRAPGWWVGGET